MNDCPHRVLSPTWSPIITAFNCGEELVATVASAKEHAGDLIEQVVVVDDGSTDGSADPLIGQEQVHVIRHDTSQGIGRGRNAGALRATGDVLSFHDGHMQFQPEAVQACVRRALQEVCIVYAYSRGYKQTCSTMPSMDCNRYGA
jgi:glycosyltransferase involved in cell wall biosynthesis